MAYYLMIEDNKILGASQAQSGGNIIDVEVTEEVYNSYGEDHDRYIWDGSEVIENPNYEEIKRQQQEAEFNRQFFNTSLGYVRRSVTMKDGSKKDFLCDILPLLVVNVPVLTYARDLTQNQVLTTEQFINECKQQLLIDFYGVQQ